MKTLLNEYYDRKSIRQRYIKEETILTPVSSEFRIEGLLWDVENLLTPDYGGLYTFTFQPMSYIDQQQLLEHAEQCLARCRMEAGSSSTRDFRLNVEDRKGMPVVSQLYAPKLNVELDHWSLYHGRNATIQLFLRDDSAGEIFLNAGYVDLDEPTEAPASDAKDVEEDSWDDPFEDL